MMSSVRSLRIGFLGVGNIALEHVAAIHSLGHVIVAGSATNIDSPRWRTFVSAAPTARFEPNGETLLSDPDIDAIISCLPWNLTEVWLPRLLVTPKPVLIEKPIALSSHAAWMALSHPDAKPNNKIVGFNRRFYPSLQRLKERFSQGGLKAAEINISEMLNRLAELYGPDIISYAVIYSSSHIIDAAMYLFGKLKPIRLYGHEEQGYPVPFRSLTGLLETAEGIPITLSINAENPVSAGIRLFFDDGTTWHLSPMEHLVAYRGYKIIEPTAEVKIRRYIPQPFFESIVDASLKPGFLEQMRAFTLGEGREIAATPADSVELLRFIETIYQIAT